MEEKQSDIKELEGLVNLWQDRLFRFAYMRIGNREDAEDLLQETFLALYSAMRDGKKIRDVGNYLFRSLSNACSSYFRRNPPPQISIEDAPELAACDSDRDIYNEYLRILRLLENLPREQAEILRMKCYDGLTFREIAEIEEIPEPTVKSRYRYAILTLQKRIKKQ